MHHRSRPAPGRRHRQDDAHDDSGFTLVELLVVMVVIGVLASIAVPVFSAQRQRAAATALTSDLRNIATAVQTQGLEAGRFPTTAELNGVDPALRTSQGVRVSVVWRSATDFCLAGTSSAAGPDTSGIGRQVGITTKVVVVSATRPASTVTSTDPGCLGAPGAVFITDQGYWAADGFHSGSIV